MVQIGELNRRIKVEQLIEERDSFGGVVGEWIQTGMVWAKVEQMMGGEGIDDNQVKATQKYRFVIRFYPSLSPKHRIVYMDKVFEIISVRDIVDRHRFTEIICKEVKNGNLFCETKTSKG